jgi:hypothetical protein
MQPVTNASLVDQDLSKAIQYQIVTLKPGVQDHPVAALGTTIKWLMLPPNDSAEVFLKLKNNPSRFSSIHMNGWDTQAAFDQILFDNPNGFEVRIALITAFGEIDTTERALTKMAEVLTGGGLISVTLDTMAVYPKVGTADFPVTNGAAGALQVELQNAVAVQGPVEVSNFPGLNPITTFTGGNWQTLTKSSKEINRTGTISGLRSIQITNSEFLSDGTTPGDVLKLQFKEGSAWRDYLRLPAGSVVELENEDANFRVVTAGVAYFSVVRKA